MQVGDHIVSINEQPVSGISSFRIQRIGLQPDRDVLLSTTRKGKVHDLQLHSWDWVDGLLYEALGLTVDRYVASRRPYVRITRVRPEGPAAEIGLTTGDVVDAIKPLEGRFARAWRIIDRGRFATLVRGLEVGSAIEVDVYRDGERLRGTLVVN